jgi:dipeptidyl aminopeptidase/acylaminoacyl peptidase
MRGALLLALGVMALSAPVWPGHARKTLLAERTSYSSGALTITAWRFVDSAAGTHPVVLFNHGGTGGLTHSAKRRCLQLAREGFYVFASSYRGEDGSDGEIEIALGEVDDVINALPAIAQDPRADSRRVALLGVSHGALISLQAAKREPSFKALVFAYGVSDIAAWYQHLVLTDNLGNDAQSVALFGGSDAERQQKFAARSGIADLQQLPADLAILLVQGALDTTVPAAQIHLLDAGLRAQGFRPTLRLDSAAGHAYLIRDPLDSTQEKAQAHAAWRQIIAFLHSYLNH